ncbi:MAG: hypothetical protein CL868_09095 [Cytophagaceae bacterium]|nr:hypothetical protein [Cytophagaceae bacterium]|tara:strand:+ start:2323 stop:2571 length:249 start_codon:yes stop_codon:yes gene_type:complete
MAKRIKLIWDFRGPTAQHIAIHHAKHLTDYAKTAGLPDLPIGHEAIVPGMHHMAYMVVNEENMVSVRDALKPNRGTIYNPIS